MMDSFLLIGQSNMAGRGVIGSVPPIENEKLFVARNARWQPMFVPVNPDRPFSGICLAESFADAHSKAHPEREVGLIPCADGGTSMEQWAPGGLLYDHAVMQAKFAMRTSRLAGILWHQGESDCGEKESAVYEEKLTAMLASLRADLGLPQVPVLLGGLGDFLAEYSQGTREYYPVINAILERVARTQPNMAFVPAHGLGAKEDNLHFNAPALREFGLRYYNAFAALEQPGGEETAAPLEDGHIRGEMERL